MAPLRKHALRAVLPLTVAVLAGCGASSEEGVLPEGPPAGDVVDLEFDASSDRLLRAHPHALLESRDGGATWRALPLPASVGGGRITDVATAAGTDDVLYVAGPGIGVLRSADAGRSWTTLDNGLPGTAVASFATHADQPGTLYAFIEGEGLYRSEDAGVSWMMMDTGPGGVIREFLHSDMEGSMQTGWLFAATPEGVRRSMDCFCGWRPTGDLAAGEVYDVAYDPLDPKRVYAATEAGIFRSEDGGEAWEAVPGPGSAPVSLATDGEGVLYTSTREGAVSKSIDRGASWEIPGA